MTTQANVSEDLRIALEEARSSFLSKKITIDDVSRDINALEDELNKNEATDEFSYPLEHVFCYAESQQFEDYDRQGPLIGRKLVWKKHGARWRLFLESTFAGWQVVSCNQYEDCSKKEQEELLHVLHMVGLEEGRGYSVGNKPLIDTSTEIRMAIHPLLPDFVKAFASEWTKQRYLKLRQ